MRASRHQRRIAAGPAGPRRGRGPGRARCRAPSASTGPASTGSAAGVGGEPGRAGRCARRRRRRARRRPGGRPASPPAARAGGRPARGSPAMQRTVSPRPAGGSLPVARQHCAIRAGMSPGGRKRRVVDVDHRAERGRRGRLVEQRRPRSSVSPQARMRLAEQPEAHHVAQEADRAVDAALVGEVGGRASSVSTGASSSTPTSDQVPRGDVRRAARVGERHADDRRRGVVRADRDHGRRGGQPGGLGHRRAAGGRATSPGSTERRQDPHGYVDPLGQPGGPGRGSGRRTAGSSRRSCARRPISPVSQ